MARSLLDLLLGAAAEISRSDLAIIARPFAKACRTPSQSQSLVRSEREHAWPSTGRVSQELRMWLGSSINTARSEPLCGRDLPNNER